MKTFLFVIAIFFAIWWTSVNIAKLIRHEGIPFGNFILMSVSWTAIITHLIGIW